MPCSSTANHDHKKPISGSDPNKSNTHFLPHQSSTTCSQLCSTNDSKKKRVFTWMALRGLGCRGIPSPTTTLPAIIRLVPEREGEKLRKKKKKKKKRSKTASYNPNKSGAVDVSEVCCTPPKFGFAYDVAPMACERSNHRERFRAARQTANIGRASNLDLPSRFNTTSCSPTPTNESNSRQYRRLRQLPEIMMLRNTSLLERSLNTSDRFGDWRLNLDPLLYEELLHLSDRIGYVGAGLQEDEILGCLRKTNKHSRHTSLSSILSRNDHCKCSICQEECKGNEDLGRLACGHYHHIDCIKQWLLQKNECPLCKTAAVAAK